MLKAAIEKILTLADPNIVELYGNHYTDKDLDYIPHDLMAHSLVTHTLSSIVDYICNGVDDDTTDIDNRFVIHVENFDRVTLNRELNRDKNRETLITAMDDTQTFPFNRYMDVENFIIAMQSYFLQDDVTAQLIQLVSHVTDSRSVTQSDDGSTQTVTAKTGILTASQVAIPNPVQLRPICTFPAVIQPERSFVFRLRGGDNGVSAALFEADGNAWKTQAIQNIREWLNKAIPDEMKDDVIILA